LSLRNLSQIYLRSLLLHCGWLRPFFLDKVDQNGGLSNSIP
jgi:hypothetical protein